MTPTVQDNTCLPPRPAKSTGLPSLLGGRTFLLVLKKLHFWYYIFSSHFDLFFVWIHCLIIGSLQPVTKSMLFDYFEVSNTGMHVYLSRRRASWSSYYCLARKSTSGFTRQSTPV